MTEPVTWAAVGMAAVSNMATWLMIIKGKNGKKMPNGENGKLPGTAKICRERGEKLAVMETKQSQLEADIREIKEDLKEIKRILLK
jgi:hypothetical protein